MELFRNLVLTLGMLLVLVTIAVYWYAAIAVAVVTLMYLSVLFIRKVGKLWKQ